MCKSETEQPEEGTKMAATHKSLQLWIDRESRIVRDAIADGNAEEAAIFARILFGTYVLNSRGIRKGMNDG